MKRPTPALAMLIVFWVVYGVGAAIVLYRALAPLQRELLVLLGGTGAALVAASFLLLWRVPFRAPSGGLSGVAPKDSSPKR
jgi:hypothetical protein